MFRILAGRAGRVTELWLEHKQMEAVQIQLTGEMAKKYDVYYRAHVQTYGWLGWAKNGAKAGTEGMSKRMEGIQIRLVEKGGEAPGSTSGAFKERIKNPNVVYQAHMQTYGWCISGPYADIWLECGCDEWKNWRDYRTVQTNGSL